MTVTETETRAISYQLASHAPHPEFDWENLPSWARGFFSGLTSREMAGVAPSETTPWGVLIRGAVCLMAGLALSCTGLALGGYWVSLTAVGIAMTLHVSRLAQLFVVHLCAHSDFTRDKRVDVWIGRFLSALFLIEEFDSYKKGHLDHHNKKKLNTVEDPTQKYLLRHDFRPGMSVRALWTNLIVKLGSPVFHAKVLHGRITSHLRSKSRTSTLVVALYLVSVAALCQTSVAGTVVVIAWVLPLTILYNASQLLRLQVEHITALDRPEIGEVTPYHERTVDILLWSPTPSENLCLVATMSGWAWWGIKMMGHYLVKQLVLPGDTTVHASHHRVGGRKDFDSINFVASRARALERFNNEGDEGFRESRGLFATVHLSYRHLSGQVPMESR